MTKPKHYHFGDVKLNNRQLRLLVELHMFDPNQRGRAAHRIHSNLVEFGYEVSQLGFVQTVLDLIRMGLLRGSPLSEIVATDLGHSVMVTLRDSQDWGRVLKARIDGFDRLQAARRAEGPAATLTVINPNGNTAYPDDDDDADAFPF